jgi:ABC-type cobalamin/Fe3+-siderophores transport system ATPase subunit
LVGLKGGRKRGAKAQGGVSVRIRSIDAVDVPPVQEFHVSDISDVLVLAGPNGVGKTRLVQQIIQSFQNGSPNPRLHLTVEATSAEEQSAWGKNLLDTHDPSDYQKLFATAVRARARGLSSSTIFQFESDRTIQPIQPYTFSFDATDPWLEQIGATFTFNRLRDRFQDTLHSIFRKVRAREAAIAAKAIEHMTRGEMILNLAEFSDPLEPFKIAFSQLLAPKELLDVDPREQQLFYGTEGQRLPITELSSGEREVVNIAFDTLLRNPSDSIIFFDEPELHLHPELSYKLLQTLRTLGTNNQFIYCTHSADIITASLGHTVVFISPPKTPRANQAVPVREDDRTNEALKLLGQSIGIVALGKKLVLIEGSHGSLDKQTYGEIILAQFPELVLVPSGGKGLITSFESVVANVLERTIWGVQFFMLCDRDAVPLSQSKRAIEERGKGRVKVLSRYHLGNYFLEEDVLAGVFAQTEPEGSWLRSASAIGERCREIGRSMVSYAVALIVAGELREKVGNVSAMPGNCHGKTVDELVRLVATQVATERARVAVALHDDAVEELVRHEFAAVEKNLEPGQAAWKEVIPGKPLLGQFAASIGFPVWRLKRMYLQQALKHNPSPFREVIDMFAEFRSM